MRNSHVIYKNNKVLYVLLLNILRVLCDFFCKAIPLLPAVEGLFGAPDGFGIGWLFGEVIFDDALLLYIMQKCKSFN